jgi:hypothetical protein
MVQALLNPIAKCRKQLHALWATAKLASTDQGIEEHEKKPHDTIAIE